MEAIRGAKISPAVDPPGSAGVHSWGPIARRYRLSLTVVNEDGLRRPGDRNVAG